MISVITVTFNAAGTLPALIESMRAQRDPSFEWVVVDGASTDGTVDLLAASGDVVSNWISESDFGIYHALNKALALASGDYYLVMGADDVLLPGAISAWCHAAALGTDIVSAPVVIDGRIVEPCRSVPGLRSGPPMVSAHSVGTLIRRSLHEELGLYSRRFPIAADTHFLLKAVRAGCRFSYLDQPVGTFGREGVSSADTLGALTESLRANIDVNGRPAWQMLLFCLRLIKNYPRIARRVSVSSRKTSR